MGPQITLGMDSGDFDKKLNAAKQKAADARKELAAVNREMDALAKKGQRITSEVADRVQAAEQKVDAARAEVSGLKASGGGGGGSSGGGRPSFGFRQWQSQFADHGSGGGMGRHAGMLLNGATADGMLGSVLQAAGVMGIYAKIAHEVIKIPDTMERIQSKIRDYEREEKGTLTYMSPMEKLRRRQKEEAEIVGEVPIIGGIIGKGNSVGTHVRQLLAGEENIDQVDLRVKNEEAMRTLGLGGSMETQRRVNAQKVSQFSRAYAAFVGGLDPSQVELQKNIAAATALLDAGTREAAKGNIRGDLARGGFGGAADLFNRANQLLPGIAPQNASSTYQAIEQGRIADRNFARSQMTRAGPRTGD